MTKQEQINIHLKVLDTILDSNNLTLYTILNKQDCPIELMTTDFSVQISPINELEALLTFINFENNKQKHSISVPIEDIKPYVKKIYECHNELNTFEGTVATYASLNETPEQIRKHFDFYLSAVLDYFSQPISQISSNKIKSRNTQNDKFEEAHTININNPPHTASFGVIINTSHQYNLFGNVQIQCLIPYKDEFNLFTQNIYVPMLEIDKYPYLKEFVNKATNNTQLNLNNFKEGLNSNLKNIFLNAELSLNLPNTQPTIKSKKL